VASKVSSKVLEITPTGIKVETGEGIEEISEDTVVIAARSRPVNELADVIEAKGIPFDVIGDANTIGMAFDAVHQGYSTGTKI